MNSHSTSPNFKRPKKFNSTILFIGAFGVLFSLFYRTMGLYSASSTLEVTRDISPTLLASGFKASLVAP